MATAIVEENLPTLVKKARALKLEAIDPNNRKLVAFKLNEYLRDSGEFTYSLDFRDVEFNENIDPTEDFFANHKTGHCEYFASATSKRQRTQFPSS